MLFAGTIFCLLWMTALAAVAIYANSAACRTLVVGKVNERINGHLTVGDHRVNFISGRLRLSDIHLTDAAGSEVAGIKQLSVRWRWLALAGRAVHLSSLEIEDPALAVIYDHQDRLNLLKIVSSQANQDAEDTAGDAGWQLRVNSLNITNGRLSLERPAAGWRGHAEGIGLMASGDLHQRTADIRVSIGNAEIERKEAVTAVHDIVMSARYRPTAAQPLNVSLQTPGSQLTVKGRLDLDQPHPAAALVGDFDVDLEAFRQWLPQPAVLYGRARGEVTLNGHLDDPSAALLMTLSDGGGWGTSLRSLSLEAVLDRRVVEIVRLSTDDRWGALELSGQLDLRPVFPNSFRHAALGLESAALQLDIRGRDVVPRQIPALGVAWDGVWQGHVRVQGTVGQQGDGAGQAEINLSVEKLKADEAALVSDGEFAAYLRWADRKIKIDSCQATLGDSTLQANGVIDWGARQLASSATLRLDRIDTLGQALGIALPSGRGILKLDAHGPWSRPEAHGALLTQDVAFGRWRFGRLLAEADMKPNGTIHFSRLVLENQGSYLEGKGELGVMDDGGRWLSDPAIDATFKLDQVTLSDFYKDQDVTLSINGKLHATGTIAHPQATLDLAPSSVAWKGIDARADGRILWDDGHLSVPGVNLSSGQSSIGVQGDLRLRSPEGGPWLSDPQVTAEVTSDALHLKDILPGLGGKIALHASLAGTVSTLSGAYLLEGRGLDLRYQKLDSLHLSGRLADKIVHLDRLAVAVAPGQELSGSGWYAFDQRIEARLSAKGIALRHIEGLQKGGVVDGTLEGAIDASGTLAHPQVSGHMLIRQPEIYGHTWKDFRLNLSLLDQHLALDADLTFKLTANGYLDSGDFDLAADLDRTDLGPYLAVLADQHWKGRLTGRVQARGNWHQPKNIDAVLSLSDANLIYQEAELLSLERLEARLHNGSIDLPETRMKLMQDGHLKVAVNGQLAKSLSAKVGGRLPMAALDPFSDEIGNAAGNILFQIEGQGPWQRMRWQGDLAMEELKFLVIDMGQSVHGLNGKITISPELLSIDSISGKLDDGSFSLDGQVGLAGLRPEKANLRFQAQALPLQWPDTMDAKIAADLTLKGDSRDALLDGRVVLLEGAYYKNVRLNLLSTITDPQRAEPVPSRWEAPEWMNNIRLAVTLTHRYPMLVDNNVARLEVAPDLKLSGTAARPILNGRAQVTDGEVIFRKKTFEVKRGVVDFVNPYKIEPSIDIQAETQIRKWQVRLSAEGTPENLKIALSSDPPESDANILSLILLGQTSTELSKNGGGGEATTGQMLAALAASAWGEDIKKGTGVDILEVETGAEADEESSDRIQVTVGKKLTSRLTVKYAVESKDNQLVQRAISEYRLLEHMSASGFQDTAGNYGGELLFRIEFR